VPALSGDVVLALPVPVELFSGAVDLCGFDLWRHNWLCHSSEVPVPRLLAEVVLVLTRSC
jgi:hypothetical protein